MKTSFRRLTVVIAAALAALLITTHFATASLGSALPVQSGESHPLDIVPFMASFMVILLAAKLGGEIIERFGQPAVLGELLLGVVIGNLTLFGFVSVNAIKANQGIEIAAELGVILLLFQVGLESRVEELKKVGLSSVLVALVGVIAPMILGYFVGIILLPGDSPLVHIFIGATLAATSVGLTARVMKDLGKTNTSEARIVLGAAVIDDVMGLVVLAVVGGLIASASHAGTGSFSWIGTGAIILKATVFLFGSIVVGQIVVPHFFQLVSHMRVQGVMLVMSIAFCFAMAALSASIGLAPIVGAFAAGLILEPSHYLSFTNRGERPVEELVAPVADLFVPVFFVLMGLKVDLRFFADPQALKLACALVVMAIIGKLVCGLAVLEKGLNRLVISVGMIPRGEVGLIFASMGAKMMLDDAPVIDAGTYAAVVIMVMLTTLVTPFWLKALYTKEDKIRLARQG
ncbi:MAG: cation:proton antiporter [Armatimonadota bacterium]